MSATAGSSEHVVIAMSGGVDSSVAAALLKSQGYQVTGMMMRLWSESGREADNRCCTPDAMAQARRVAAILGIPFYVIDAKLPFREIVLKYFLDGYAQGDTPNPCLACNRQIRWEFLLQKALDSGAQYLATGHYVRLRQDNSGLYQIQQAVDPTKDQSYVLHVLNQNKLAHAKFPIGEYPKTEIRQLATQFGLPVAHRPDSQDLCFLGDEDYRDFLRRNIPAVAQSGPILNQRGEILGEHQGLPFYTIGQRKGLGITSPEPLYVIEKIPAENSLVVGRLEELGKTDCLCAPFNWIAGSPPAQNFRAQVKIRYTASPAWGALTILENNQVQIHFDEPLRDITPGQAAVAYDGTICLGGGIIQQAL
ncbi:MAG: tRNA 2-thiouridine(34) synthase MnmA [Anaerolineales bacterium]|jgi:tRNA-specific 2-thiouridylase|nr:tRNA 2-thiouridine(34) synthase MnmA [Anaerolineales bacterium]